MIIISLQKEYTQEEMMQYNQTFLMISYFKILLGQDHMEKYLKKRKENWANLGRQNFIYQINRYFG